MVANQSSSSRFQPEQGPSRGLLRDCTTSPINRLQHESTLVSRGRREPQVVPLSLWTGHWTPDILRDCDRCHGSCPPINTADTQHYKTRYIIHLPRHYQIDRMSHMKCKVLRQSQENVNSQMIQLLRDVNAVRRNHENQKYVAEHQSGEGRTPI